MSVALYKPKLRSVSVKVSPPYVVGLITVDALGLTVTAELNPLSTSVLSDPAHCGGKSVIHAVHPKVISNCLTEGLPKICQIGEPMPRPMLPAPPVE